MRNKITMTIYTNTWCIYIGVLSWGTFPTQYNESCCVYRVKSVYTQYGIHC